MLANDCPGIQTEIDEQPLDSRLILARKVRVSQNDATVEYSANNKVKRALRRRKRAKKSKSLKRMSGKKASKKFEKAETDSVQKKAFFRGIVCGSFMGATFSSFAIRLLIKKMQP